MLSSSTIASPVDSLTKVGEAKLKVLFWDVYLSTLYNQSGKYQANQFPMALRLNYLRDIDAQDLLKSTEDEWEKLGLNRVQFEHWIVFLKDIFPDIKKGDSVVLYVDDNKQSEFFHNGISIGSIQDTSFGSSFLRIWLDENCSYPKVRNKLIGLNK